MPNPLHVTTSGRSGFTFARAGPVHVAEHFCHYFPLHPREPLHPDLSPFGQWIAAQRDKEKVNRLVMMCSSGFQSPPSISLITMYATSDTSLSWDRAERGESV